MLDPSLRSLDELLHLGAHLRRIALQSAVALIAIGFVLINFLIDYLYTVLDPRIRERSS